MKMLHNFSKLTKLVLLKVIMIFVITFLAFGILTSRVSIGFNDTDSISGRLFLIIKDSYPEKKLDKIIFKINNLHTKYGDKTLIKRVIGFEGDRILIKNDHIFLNQKELGIIKPESLAGNPLIPLLDDNQYIIIPKDHYFVYSPHIDSYDSRYKSIGLVSKTETIGVAYEIF